MSNSDFSPSRIFPEPSWELLYKELGGTDLSNKIYYDDFNGRENYYYDFKFDYKGQKARFTAQDFTYTRGSLNENDHFLKIGFEYPTPPRIEILLRKRHLLFDLWSKIIFRNVSLNNTPLGSHFTFESNRPALASRLIHQLFHLGDEAYLSNQGVDPSTGKYSLEYKSIVWLTDYDQLKSFLDKTLLLFEESLGIELLAG